MLMEWPASAARKTASSSRARFGDGSATAQDRHNRHQRSPIVFSTPWRAALDKWKLLLQIKSVAFHRRYQSDY